ncbi:MAG TPA: ABC transporter ATP-binding protein [Yeosuana sp.]
MLQIKNISFGYKNALVLENISFNVKKGEHLSIIGESGSGKSTLLKLIYGTYDLTKGQIFWNDTKILGPKYNLIIGPEFIKYVAQEFDLMPFTTVSENIGEFLSNFFPKEKQKRIAELLEVVELEPFAKTKVKELSGGQKQRVALARALAKQPQLLLLDEPFSHIDNFKKQSLRRSLFKYLKEKEITCIVATHDKQDVLSYSDTMIVLHEAKIIANDTPQNLYKDPKQSLIASFFDEFNDFELQGIKYAHQLKIVGQSDLEGRVKTSYFIGNSWLIEVEYHSKAVFIKHHSQLKANSTVFFKILS